MIKKIFRVLFTCITIAALMIFRIDVISNENGYHINMKTNKTLFIIEKGDRALTVGTIFYCGEPELYILR